MTAKLSKKQGMQGMQGARALKHNQIDLARTECENLEQQRIDYEHRMREEGTVAKGNQRGGWVDITH